MQSKLLKYRIGLAVIGLFTLVLLIMLLVQAGGTKQDAQTIKKAQTIAEKLNDNFDATTVPSSLAALGIPDVPDTISYQKLSSTRYKFCLTFKSNSSGFDSAGAVTTLLYRGASGDSYNYDGTGSTDSNYLTIPLTYHKGQNCQTIKPNFFGTTGDTGTTGTAAQPYVKDADGGYTVCGVKTNYYEGDSHVTSTITASSTSIQGSATDSPYVGAYVLYMISSGSKFFDEQCNQLQQTAIQTGDTLSTFDITSSDTDAVSIFLKRSY